MANTENQDERKQTSKTLFNVPLTGCFTVILLSALCGIAITECQRSKLRYEMDEIRYKKFMDSINAKHADATTFVLNQNLKMEK